MKVSLGFSQVGNLDTSFTLLSSNLYDYKNPQFDKSGSSINYSIRDCIFAYEKWSTSYKSNIAVRFMKYNSLSPEIELTSDTLLNINPSVAYRTSSAENNPGAIVFQSNRNGNNDIYYSYYNSSDWSNPTAITNDTSDETNPCIIPYSYNNIPCYLLSYKKGNDIFVKNFFNGVWLSEVNISSSDTLECSSPTLTKDVISMSRFYLAYQQNNIGYYSIIYHPLQIASDGSISIQNRIIVDQTGFQKYIRFSNGINNSILNYDYISSGIKNYYSAIITGNAYVVWNQSASFGGDNFGGTGSSHGDITLDNISGYSLCAWVRKVVDSTQVVISPNIVLANTRKFYVGNLQTQTFINTSTKLVLGQQNLFRIRILWEKQINGRTALIESFRDMYLTGINNGITIPEKFSLSQNYPNPFNPATNLEFRISELGFVSLKIYDVLGNEIATLVNERKTPGSYSVKWNASNFSSGIYFYKLIAGEFSETRRMLLLK